MMHTDTVALAIGQRVALLDGDDRVQGYGLVVGAATYWPEDPTAELPVRGYVVRLDPPFRGWIETGDRETSGRSYISCEVVAPDSVRPVEGRAAWQADKCPHGARWTVCRHEHPGRA